MSTVCALRLRRGLRRGSLAALLSGLGAVAPVWAQATLYERDGFEGRHVTTEKRLSNLERAGLHERVASVVVAGQRWEVCDTSRYQGQCRVLLPGRYPSLAAMGMDQRVMSVRIVGASEVVDEAHYAPASRTGCAAEASEGCADDSSSNAGSGHRPAPAEPGAGLAPRGGR